MHELAQVGSGAFLIPQVSDLKAKKREGCSFVSCLSKDEGNFTKWVFLADRH